jgi:hypothetical protein
LKNTALIIFIKNNGNVKTRIANETNKETAQRIYNELLDQTSNLCKEVQSSVDIYIFFTSLPCEERWIAISNGQHLQDDGELGERMFKAFDIILEKYEKAIIIGSDCPYISKEHIKEAQTLLDKCDAVVGPAEDGGYYLLGLKKAEQEIFQNIEWSTENVYHDTCDRFFELRYIFSTLESLSDVDYFMDYQTWKNNIHD